MKIISGKKNPCALATLVCVYVLNLLERIKKIYFSQTPFLMMLKQTARCLTLLDHLIGRMVIQVRHWKNVFFILNG